MPDTVREKNAGKKCIDAHIENWNTNQGAKVPVPRVKSKKMWKLFIEMEPEQWTKVVTAYHDPIHILALLTPDDKHQWAKAINDGYKWRLLMEYKNVLSQHEELKQWIQAIEKADKPKSNTLINSEKHWETILQHSIMNDRQHLLEIVLGLKGKTIHDTLMIIAAIFPQVLANDFDEWKDGHFVAMTEKFYQGMLLSARGMNRICHRHHPLLPILNQVVSELSWKNLQEHLAQVRQLAAPEPVCNSV